uniref:Uncharacterized protein n=1 Tax=Rhizophora mucronata TaxID=61149 RepID=A0A2P2PZC3_RHIMU
MVAQTELSLTLG